MDNYLSIGKKWRVCGIVSTTFVAVWLFIFILFFVLWFCTNTLSEPVFITFLVIGFILFLVGEIIGLVISIKILSIKWDDPELEQGKEIWGMLGIFFIGPISALVYGNKIIAKYK